MLFNKFLKNSKKLNNTILKTSRKYFGFIEDEMDDQIEFKDKTSRQSYEDWKRKTKEAQEDMMKRAHEMVKRKQEEAKRGNKEFLLKMKIPGVKEDPEK